MNDIISEIYELNYLKKQFEAQELRILKALTTMLNKKGYPGAKILGYKSIDDDTIIIRFSDGAEIQNVGYSTYDVDDFISNLEI